MHASFKLLLLLFNVYVFFSYLGYQIKVCTLQTSNKPTWIHVYDVSFYDI